MGKKRKGDDARELVRVERRLALMDAAASFRRYLPYVDPSYDMQWFHRLIADKCQDLLEGRIQNLMIFVPPQHGKSQIVSRAFPSWALGRNPDLKIASASYSNDLATGFSVDVQRLMESAEYLELFPNTRIPGVPGLKPGESKSYKRNEDYFEIVGRKGSYKGVGVMQGLTGRTVDIAIIDDPVKDASEAFSETYRNKVWHWYTSVLRTRLHNRSHQIFIMTRWHEDDLAGRILKAEPEEWEVIRIPAICETEGDGGLSERHVGEALWEERHSLSTLMKKRNLSERDFSAMYQQSPSIDGGNIIKTEWFKRISSADFWKLYNSQPKSRQCPFTFFLDTAYTSKTSNDPSGIIGCCRIGNDLYITSAAKVFYNFPDLIRFIPRFVNQNGYGPGSSIRIEPKANGLSVIDQLRTSTTLSVMATPNPEGDKSVRLNTSSPVVESGHVYIVDGQWNEPFVHEVCAFPAAAHDEYVDCLCYAIAHFFPARGTVDVARLQEALKR